MDKSYSQAEPDTLPETGMSAGRWMHRRSPPSPPQKVGDILDPLDLPIALELLANVQAVDLHGVTKLSAKLALVHVRIRALSRFIDDDRPLGHEIEQIADESIKTGDLVKCPLHRRSVAKRKPYLIDIFFAYARESHHD